MIEHDAAGSFQKSSLILMMREIDKPGYMETAGLQLLDYVPPPLGPAAWGHHRIQHDCAVMVKGNPIVGKNRIRCVQVFFIFKHNHIDTGIAQTTRQKIELHPSSSLNFLSADVCRLPLKHE